MSTYMNVNLAVHLFLIIIFGSLTFVHTVKIRKELKNHKNWKLLLRQTDCGESFSNRIIGGREAGLGKYPWMARLVYVGDKGEDIYDCGGTIINSRYILTATHCSPSHTKLNFKLVRLGEYRVSTDEDCEYGICAPPVQDLAMESHVCHENYSIDYYHNDICLIRTEKEIMFHSFVLPICLPFYDFFTFQNFTDSRMEVAGWGVKNITTAETSDVLEFVALPIVPLQTCNNVYFTENMITERQICAGGEIGFDSCIGDSGGPLMKAFSTNGPPKYFIIGVVSFGPTDCGKTTAPGVYSRVDKYMMWILDNLKE